ncbi:MAG: hypothetical protein IPP71_07295 [Bacteroidetes bacterium]|nr:hypothetical protein [Bacteroidota bacterium]
MKRIFSVVTLLVLLLVSRHSVKITVLLLKLTSCISHLLIMKRLMNTLKYWPQEPDNAIAIRNIADCYRLTNNSRSRKFILPKW